MAATQRRSVHTRERASDALARCGPDDLDLARTSRDLLLATARVLAELLDHDPDRADCGDAGCAMAGAPNGELCGLIHRLADVEPYGEASHDPSHETRHETVGIEAASRRFEAALTGAIDAVRRCRQTEHGAGRCWFTSLPDLDGCGDVLRAAHRLG